MSVAVSKDKRAAMTNHIIACINFFDTYNTAATAAMRFYLALYTPFTGYRIADTPTPDFPLSNGF